MTKTKNQNTKTVSNLNFNTPKKLLSKLPTQDTYGTGRRKSAIARVWLKPGNGSISINTVTVEKYFGSENVSKLLLKPLIATKTYDKYNVFCTVKGGGKMGQVGAIVLGVARALDKMDSSLHTILHKQGFLTRDSRAVERKKYGKHKARKSTQFSKR